MKRLFTLLIVVLMTVCAFAQAPEKISYQAVIRNSSNQLVINQAIGMRISILQGTSNGTVIYQETYNPNPQTNANGLVAIEIGGGLSIIGTFVSIDWSAGSYFIRTETDPNGGTNYTITGTSQIISVPYALYAKQAGNVFSGNYNDLTYRPDFTNWDSNITDDFSGNYSDLTNKPNFADSIGKQSVLITGDQTIAGNKTFIGTISANDHVIKDVANPVNLTDAANKAYVDLLEQKIKNLNNTLIAGGFVIDYDGNYYNTVKIGNSVWMAENLKTTTLNDGKEITDDHNLWMWGDTAAYTTYPEYTDTYGLLYNGWAVNSGKLCPAGWHMPTYTEWNELFEYLGGDSIASDKLREAGNVHWKYGNHNATNESGFSALPGGWAYWWRIANFLDQEISGYWWAIPVSERIVQISTNHAGEQGNYDLHHSYSVRCLKDN